jgi:phosphatidyl-myo-inositol alpha-mannosyltransferase
MKIGFLLDTTLDSTDGVQQFVLQIGDFMSRQGHEVHYIVGESSRGDISNVHSVSRNVKVSFNGNVISSPLPIFKRNLIDLLDTLQLDLIHVQTPYSPFFAGRVIKIAAKRGIPVVSTFHILPFGPAATVANAVLGAWLSLNKSTITISTAVSKPAAIFAQKYYHLRSRVIPNPIDVASFRSDSVTNVKPKIVFLGRLVERKGSMKLLEAIDYMQRNALYEGDFSVIIGGKGQMHDHLQRYIGSHGLSGFVTLAGFLAEEDKKSFLAQADIAVFPSTSGESFGISLLEAFAACSGIVLAGDNPGYASVVPDERNIIAPTNTADFANTLAYWLEHGDERYKMAKLQKKYVEDFDIQHVGAIFEAVYAEALQTRKDS